MCGMLLPWGAQKCNFHPDPFTNVCNIYVFLNFLRILEDPQESFIPFYGEHSARFKNVLKPSHMVIFNA